MATRVSDRRRTVATLGEEAAAQYLHRAGYAILARNYRCPAGEIDIVAQDGPQLVFVEVRTRSSRRFGTPEESITRTKRAKMAECAYAYLAEQRVTQPWRVDFVGVDVEGGRVRAIRHLKHALE
jgi:putative endonuclease